MDYAVITVLSLKNQIKISANDRKLQKESQNYKMYLNIETQWMNGKIY